MPLNPQVKLNRTAYKTSREAEFASVKELTNQTGHKVEQWPLVILKELVDNALDACEEAGFAPVVHIAVTADAIIVADNGPGIPAKTVVDMLDYSSRTSSREAYVSPTRGAQGNALKTLVAMPYVLDGASGQTIIEAQAVRHAIAFSVDPITAKPKIERRQTASPVKNGTKVTVAWPQQSCSLLDNSKAQFLQVADRYAFFNPHLTLHIDWRGEKHSRPATDTDWKHWLASYPTSPHWYDAERFWRRIAAQIEHENENGGPRMTVAEFTRSFDGLTSTAKAKTICEAAGAGRASLESYFGVEGQKRAAFVLAHMKSQARAVKPKALGFIGREHLLAKLEEAGVALKTFDYRHAEFEHDGLPYVAEIAFGYCPDVKSRQIITGVNWSVAISANPFRSLGGGGESLDTMLAEQYAGPDEPVVTVLHLACPKVDYLDRGKSSIVIPGSAA